MRPKIEDIKINMEKLNKIMIKPNTKNRQWLMRSLIGGLCVKCQEVPTKKVSYYITDAWLVEWYCDKCFNDSMRQDGRRKKDIDKLN